MAAMQHSGQDCEFAGCNPELMDKTPAETVPSQDQGEVSKMEADDAARAVAYASAAASSGVEVENLPEPKVISVNQFILPNKLGLDTGSLVAEEVGKV